MKYRFAFDMGTNSLGWAVFTLNEKGEITELCDAGVRIFPDGREPQQNGRVGESLAVTRRTARGMRRNRDRRTLRKEKLLEVLVLYGLMPEDGADRKALEKLNPYEARANAAGDAMVSPHELGRALFHLGLRRGFQSNRKSDVSKETEFKKKISDLQQILDKKGLTLGQYLWQKYREVGNSAAIRFKGKDGDLYPNRQMYKDEFQIIRRKQSSLLDQSQWNTLEDIIFFQRKLRPQEIGKCQFYTDQERAYTGLPIAGKFRIIQELNNLAWLDERLTPHELTEEQRHTLFKLLHKKKSTSWGGLRQLKDNDGTPLFPKGSTFNYEDNTGTKKGFEGNKTYIELSEILGSSWESLSETQQNDLVQALYSAEKDDALTATLTQNFGLTLEAAQKVATYPLPQKTVSVSRKFMEDITPIMLASGEKYHEAITHLKNEYGQPLHHSHFEDGEIFDRLPYYGQVLTGSVMGAHPESDENKVGAEYKYGKIGNPTVHVALNQLRRVVNTLAATYATPEEVHIELSRDLKNSKSSREEISKEIAKNKKENKRRAKICQENGLSNPTRLDLKKVKLWEELGANALSRKCVFSGKNISAAMLFNGEVEIEHILPFSRTLDDSMANLTVSLRQANRIKGNNTPFEAMQAFAQQGWNWEEICRRANDLPKSKRWRFTEGALEKFEEKQDFIARQLTDNAYISRTAKRYLGKICDPRKIVCVNGQLTSLMRGKWHLNKILSDHNKKERNDHRHHTIDAIVTGLTERSMLQKISTARAADDRVRILLPDLPEKLQQQIQETVRNTIVSYKPDHGTKGGFFQDTAYGLVRNTGLDATMPEYNRVTTKKIDALKHSEIGKIRDPYIRQQVIDFVKKETKLDVTGKLSAADKTLLKKELPALLTRFGNEVWPTLPSKNNEGKKSKNPRSPLKRVRLLIKTVTVEIPTSIKEGPAYKAYAVGKYACCDIWLIPSKGGKKPPKAEGVFHSYLDMARHQKTSQKSKPHPAAKFIMRLFKDDMVKRTKKGQTEYMRVAGFSTTDNKLDFLPHNETNGTTERRSINTFRYNKKDGRDLPLLEKVRLTPIGVQS